MHCQNKFTTKIYDVNRPQSIKTKKNKFKVLILAIPVTLPDVFWITSEGLQSPHEISTVWRGSAQTRSAAIPGLSTDRAYQLQLKGDRQICN